MAMWWSIFDLEHKENKMSGVGPRSAPTYNISVPSNYVAGIGRGALGFTTRSDIGPARPATGAPSVDAAFGQPPPGYVAGLGRGMGDLARSQGEAAPVPAGETFSFLGNRWATH